MVLCYMELMINVLDKIIYCVLFANRYINQTFHVIYCTYIIKILTASHISFSYSF